MIHSSIQINVPEVVRILKVHKVKRAYAFGSVCTNDFNQESGVDLLIAFDITEPFEGYTENFWKMEDELQKLLQRNVDLVPEHTLKNPYFIRELEKTKTVLYE
jgi:uncharacterized protein